VFFYQKSKIVVVSSNYQVNSFMDPSRKHCLQHASVRATKHAGNSYSSYGTSSSSVAATAKTRLNVAFVAAAINAEAKCRGAGAAAAAATAATMQLNGYAVIRTPSRSNFRPSCVTKT